MFSDIEKYEVDLSVFVKITMVDKSSEHKSYLYHGLGCRRIVGFPYSSVASPLLLLGVFALLDFGFDAPAFSFCRDFSHCRRSWMRPWNSMDVCASSPLVHRITISSFSMDITLKIPLSFSYFSPTMNSNSADGFIFPSNCLAVA
jgi:hypothetical protein